MFMKQYNYKPRSNSTSSTGSQGVAGSPPKEGADKSTTASVAQQAQGATAQAGPTGRRRSSATEKFAGLSAHKRQSQDGVDAKRASFADQKPGQGILGGMWNSFTTGQGK